MSTANKKSKCTDCNKAVGEKENGMQCDSCEGWFHAKCEKVTEDAYHVFGQYQDTVHWYCSQCSKGVNKLFKAITQMNARQDKLEQDMVNLGTELKEIKSEKEQLTKVSQDMSELRKEMETITAKVAEIDTVVENAIEAKLIGGLESKVDGKVKILKEDVEESIEIEKRKGNLILHGVKELHRQNPEDDGNEHDRCMIEEILKVGLKMDYSRHIEEVFRIGRYDEAKIKEGKIRPIRVKVKTIEGRAELLKRAKDLKDSGFKHVYIAPDLTRKQQLLDKDLREKLKKFKEEAGEDEKRFFRIKSGKVVKNEKGKQDIIVYQPSLNVTQ